MKREIKFKRYHFDFNGKCCYVSEWGFIDNAFVSPASISTEDRERVVDCQYTGLKDKHGKEIYEGHICSNYGGVVIEWRQDRCRYDFKYPVRLMTRQWMGGIDETFAERELEVIGNIYENPELIKEEQPYDC